MAEATATDWAWAAGFFDGEGSVVLRKNRYGLRITISQKDRRVLDRFQRITGCGRVFGPYRKVTVNGLESHIYNLHIDQNRETYWVLRKMWPWLDDAKKEQAMATALRDRRIRKTLWIGHHRYHDPLTGRFAPWPS